MGAINNVKARRERNFITSPEVFDHAIALCAAADGFSESLRGRDEEGKQKGVVRYASLLTMSGNKKAVPQMAPP